MKEFKVGDKVYFPFRSTKVHTLQHYTSVGTTLHKLKIVYENGELDCFIPDGRRYDSYLLTTLVHATPENHELLEKLYGVEFEKPPVKPTSREIIQAMLERGDKCVICWVSDNFQDPSIGTDPLLELIEGFDEKERYIDANGFDWIYATPFDPLTGKPITELPT